MAEDGSRSINEDINPPSLRRANLLALRNAGIALGWSKSADSVIADADPSDLPASLSLASKVHLPSPEKPFLSLLYAHLYDLQHVSGN